MALTPDDKIRPLSNKYGRIDNLARAVLSGDFAINYEHTLNGVEGVVQDAINDTQAYERKVARYVRSDRNGLRSKPSYI